MQYNVKLNIFEGPFDLLVYLIENAEMSIYDIQISDITDQYLQYLEQMEMHDMKLSADFMVLAATLVEIKSKMLLPRVEEEGEPTADPRTELVEKLVEYKKFSLIAKALELAEANAHMIYEKPQEDISEYTDKPDEYLKLSTESFMESFENFLERKRRVEEVKRYEEKVELEKVTVESKMAFIEAMFEGEKSKKLTFSQLITPSKTSKKEKVLTFMSVLEMVKNRVLKVKQKGNFKEMHLTLNKSEGEENVQ